MSQQLIEEAAHVSGQANTPMTAPAHALTYEQVAEQLNANLEDGLTSDEAKGRLEQYGRNEFGAEKGVQPVKIFIGQIANALTLVLILAMAASLGIQSWIEGGVVAAVIVLNIVVGFLQEFQAAKTMDSLRSLSSPTAHAVRNGNNEVVVTAEIVPGDMVELKTGDTIPADIRLVEAINFETNEALLTGESLPVRKEVNTTFPDDTGPGDRLNVAYSSSTVTKGRARGVVFATGMFTEIGQIAAALRGKTSKRRQPKRDADGNTNFGRWMQAWTLTFSDAAGRFLGVNVGTPLQRKLSKLAILLLGTAIVCAIIVLGANEFNTKKEVIIYAVATGLSMIPASLIVVLTITMAAGTKRMVQRHVIVRNLKSLEALGAVTNICSDKTGTLTQGTMIVKKAWIPGRGTYSVGATNEPFNPTQGQLGLVEAEPKDINFQSEDAEGTPIDPQALVSQDAGLQEYLNVASLANLATVHQVDGEWHARGDPTECAIQVFASRFNWNRARLSSGEKARWHEVAEFPFDSDVKKMSVIFNDNETQKQWVFTKGAVERVLTSCPVYAIGDETKPLTDAVKDDIISNMESLARLGLRVLALASRTDIEHVTDNQAELDRSKFESDLIFRGLIGLYDPPRPESAPSVAKCHQAGVSVHMLTGDHPATARAIALEVGILPTRMAEIPEDVARSMVMAASEFDKLSDEEIDQLPLLPLVVARCAPQTKVRMIEALHRRKAFVAMTGDGVNDSPSLKRSDVGIAMGLAGSDVAKEASDIVLTDDNFASILNAVEEGRRMFDNIQKFILHVLAENIAQACTLLIGLAFKDKNGLSVFPLAPVEILWIIMITSGMPDMGLGFEIAAPDIMQRPPQNLKQGVFTPELLIDMVVYGLWMSALCLASFVLVLYGFGNGAADIGENCNNKYSEDCRVIFRARSTTFACLTWFALFLAWEMVNMRRSFFRMKPKSKKYFTQWMHDVWRNPFLFWAIVAGFVTMFPIIYIPGLNTVVFKHAPISWEWGIVFIEAILFFLGIESWKWAKRIYFRRQARKSTGGVEDLETRVFGKFYNMAGGSQDEEAGAGNREKTAA
ncbi:Cation-ATPase-N domain-containing protein [Fusarium keratoplasticum]|uniref:Cation-ATPase-N domain-containing protein n=1 Tax=Fusarium keratoplasticum TaxID=1328300 RepID=A0ACC0QMG4_9HYPO|nr:Cation-ATPase-N domain-containing protein [Fusarium keratoplasticum]KAI8660212.1 Cation-ATPase-N domain-containing protein [Fusarium keratoplasticum]KAI8661236.1 Cation-ATPase-N domain-containing protein [Fusarium keratoplasticum]